MFQSNLILILFIPIICYQAEENIYGRNLSIWTKTRDIINLEIAAHRAIGLHASTELKAFDTFTYGLQLQINPLYGFNTKGNNLNVIEGSGVLMTKDSGGKIEFEIKSPIRQVNSCGFLLSSDFISNMTVFWKSYVDDNYDIIARPDNGVLVYDLNSKGRQKLGAIFFDNVPGRYFKFVVFPKSDKPLKLKIASINKCVFSGSQIITNCGETMAKNNKFASQPYGVPISIKCPTDCIRIWPCWGYKIYTADSPICWTATQNFGRWGNGEYTIYKIQKVEYFRDSGFLINGIECRKSALSNSGYAFHRKYYDFSVKESKSLS